MANPDEILKQLQKGLPIATGQWTKGSVTATETQLKSTGGLLHGIQIGSRSTPSLSIYDNASGVSGTLVISLDANMPQGNYVYDYTVVNGIATYATAGNAPIINITYK